MSRCIFAKNASTCISGQLRNRITKGIYLRITGPQILLSSLIAYSEIFLFPSVIVTLRWDIEISKFTGEQGSIGILKKKKIKKNIRRNSAQFLALLTLRPKRQNVWMKKMHLTLKTSANVF